MIKDPDVPIMINLAAPAFAIYSKAMTEANGGVSGPEAETQDTATQWLNQNSAGSGPYHMVAWERNAQIVMQKNPHYWGGEVPFERVVIRHIGDSAAQLLALENGDIDAAFNLTTEQLAGPRGQRGDRHQSGLSLDYVYMALTTSAELNEGLAKAENRLAFAHSIDYDGIIEHLMGGNAVRPANFLPIGVGGSTEQLTEEIGYQAGPRQGQGAAREGRQSRRLRVRSVLRQRRDRRHELPAAGAEDPVRCRRAPASRSTSTRSTRSTCAPSTPAATASR